MRRRDKPHMIGSILGAVVLLATACTQQPTPPAASPAAPAASPPAKAASPAPSPKAAVSPAPSPKVGVSPSPSPKVGVSPSPSPKVAASPSPAPKVAASPAAAAGPLKIGALLSFTGDLSDFGPAFLRAIELATEEINQAGGVNGQPIQVVRADDGTAPQQGTQEARRLIDVERVNAIIGAAASGVTLPVAESVTGPARILQVSSASTSPALTTARDNDFLFRTTISDRAQGVVLGDLARERGFRTACTLFVNNAYGQGLSEQFTQRFQAVGGTVTAQVPHEQQQASYAAELDRCTQGGPEVLVVISYPESAGVYLREAVERGVVRNFLFTDGPKSQELFDQLGPQYFEGMYGTAPGTLNTQTGQTFDNAYQRKYGERPPLPFLRETYDAVYAIALAAQRARSNDSVAIRDALREVSNPPGETINPGSDGWRAAVAALQAGRDINYEGAASTLDFDPNGDILRGAIEVWTIQTARITTVENREIDLTRP